MSTTLALLTFAETDAQLHSSPNGTYRVVNVGDTASPDHFFQIVARDGAVLLSSADSALLESGSFATAILWTPDSRLVAFSVRTSGPYVRDTFVFSPEEKSLIRIPTEDDDHQSAPVRWTDSKTLVVATRSPIGGKADKPVHSYHRTIRVQTRPLRYAVIRRSRGVDK
jgi:hypothetical protein